MREIIEQRLRGTGRLGTGGLGTGRLATGGALRGAGTGDFDLNPEVRTFYDAERPLRPAAVLVPLIERDRQLTMLFTKRTDHLHDHAGQVSFPGGRVEPRDPDMIETALRETEEEIGLHRSFINVVGQLQDYETGTGFRITPVVAFIRPDFTLTLDSFEVAETFEVPLDFLMDPANHQLHTRTWKGAERQFYAMPYGDYYIWGATAGMIVSLYRAIQEQG